MQNNYKTILITGASSGIGAELARQYAKNNIKLILLGRNKERLQEVAVQCVAQGATVTTFSQDLLKEKNMLTEFLHQEFHLNPIDLCILCAGIMPIESPFNAQQQEIIFTVNTQSIFNVLFPLIPLMKQLQSGQIILLSSLRAFQTSSIAPAYCASKAAILSYGRALRAELKPYNIKVSVVCPGYVDTPLTKNYQSKPFCMDVKMAASKIKINIPKNKPIIAFPYFLYLLLLSLQWLPEKFQQYVSKF